MTALPLAEGHVDGQPLEDLLDGAAAGGQRVALDEGGDLGRRARVGLHRPRTPSSMRGRMLDGNLATSVSHSSVIRCQVAGPFVRLATSSWRTNGAFWVRTSVRARSKVRMARSGSVNEARA